MLWVLLFALATNAHAGRRKDRGEPAPPEPPVVEEPAVVEVGPEPGSLWSEVPARRLMGLDGGARQVGDLVTVRITEYTVTSLDAATSTGRDSQTGASLSALFGLETRIGTAGGEGGLSLAGGSSSSFDGTGSTTRGAALDASVTCEVIEILPTGNLRIWGYKRVRVNRETQYVTFEGVVRPADVQLDNTVRSDVVAKAQIEVTGGGVVADTQGPGVGRRLVDLLWPF